MVYYTYCFAFVAPILYSLNETKVISLMCSCIQFEILRIVIYMFINGTGLQFSFSFSFFYCVLIQFWYEGNTGIIKRVWKGFFSFCFKG
jgi:hypothetical protein